MEFVKSVLKGPKRCIFEIMGKHNSKLTKEELEELEELTNFNAKQLRQWYKDFVQDCPSGYMTKEEFKHIYGQFFPAGDPTRFVDYVFNVFDIDKNGVITFKEFILAISITTRGTVEEKLNWAFSLYDFDSDGYVTREEMLDIVSAIHRMHGKGDTAERDAAQDKVDRLFTKLDSDNDGKLSREEFCKGFKNDTWIIKALLMKSPLSSSDSSNSLGTPEPETAGRSSTCTASVGNGLH